MCGLYQCAQYEGVDFQGSGGHIKLLYHRQFGMHPSMIRLDFNGRLLTDELTLSDCDIFDYDTIDLWHA